jgi:hypothetical protein
MSVQNCKRRVLSSSVRACSNCSLYGFTRRRLRRIRHAVRGGMSSSRLARLVGLTEAALKRFPHTLHHLLRRAWSTWAFCDTQAPVTLEMFIPLLYAVLRRRVLSELWFENVAAPSRSAVFGHTQERKMPSARVAIFTQPAPLSATYVTKHSRHVQTNLESFSFYRYVACYHPLRHSSVPIFCNVLGQRFPTFSSPRTS